MVVEIAFGGMGVVVVLQHLADQFLGSRLAIAPRDGQYGDIELIAMMGSQLL